MFALHFSQGPAIQNGSSTQAYVSIIEHHGLSWSDRALRGGEPNPQNVVDTGFYYINGGDVRYDALSFQIGARYTF